MHKTVSLKRKLILWLFLPMMFLWLISSIGTYYIASIHANTAYDYALADSARDLATHLAFSNGKTSLDVPRAALDMLLTDKYDTIYYKITDKDGALISGEADLPPPKVSISYGHSHMIDGILRGQKLRIASLYYTPQEGNTKAPVLIQVAETLNKRKKLAREIGATMVLPQFLLVIFVSLIVFVGVSRGLAPLHQLRKDIAMRSHLDLSPIVESDKPQEVLPLVQAINDLLGRVARMLEEEKRFIADAAHQLRTPLAGLKTQTGLLLKQAEPEKIRHSLQQISISTDRTVRLINQLLALAQVESSSDRMIELKSLDINNLVKEITAEWVPQGLRKEIDIGYEGPGSPVTIKGDKLRIKMLLDNLLDNAVRYCAPGSIITTKIEATEEEVVLTIEDNGPGIPKEERDAVFQRFYRILGRDQSIEGSGLGLAIVRDIAEIHGAKVVIEEPADHKGTSIKIIFPMGD